MSTTEQPAGMTVCSASEPQSETTLPFDESMPPSYRERIRDATHWMRGSDARWTDCADMCCDIAAEAVAEIERLHGAKRDAMRWRALDRRVNWIGMRTDAADVEVELPAAMVALEWSESPTLAQIADAWLDEAPEEDLL